MSNTPELSEEDFSAKVLRADKPVLIDFWAEWCPPCRQMGPIVDQVATEMADQADVYKVNVDKCPGLAQKYSVTSIPMFAIFKDGEVAQSFVGARPKKELLGALQKVIG